MDPVPVIIFVAEQLLKIIEYRGKIAIKFEDELKEMKEHLAMMQSYLADTDNLKRKKQFLKTGLIQLRDVVYEADDILTDCLLSESFSSIKRRWLRRAMGKKLRDLNSRMNKMESNLGKYLTDQHHMTASQGGIVQHPRDELQGMFTSQVFNSSEIEGLEGDLSKIKAWISDSVQQRIGIVGMGGLGKTTIAQKVFNDGQVASQFNNRIWVSVSQCFREDNVLACILQQLGGDGSIFDKGQMLHQICQLLTNKNYLIVLDDLWNTSLDWWNKLCSDLPKPTEAHADGASCIIVTTRIEQVAIGMQVDRTKIHRPRTLNERESWSLFCKHSFPKTGGRCQDVHFKVLGESIAKKCGGLPLAIKTIGALLASKNDMYSQWEEIEENFHQQLTETESEDSNPVMASLELSYVDLPSKLKQFLLCFSIYPENAVIDGEQVIRWWIGEGLIQPKDSKTATEVGYECLSQLASRCLIEVERRRGYDGRIYSCKMHDMVRELTIRIAQDQEFCKFDEKGRQVIVTDSRWLGLTDQINTNALQTVPNPKLRAMLLPLIPQSTSQEFDKNIMELKLKSLRVLDLSHSKIELPQDKDHKAFWDWITSFGRLAYLNLSGLSSIKELPRSVEKLHNLQLLILRGCNSLRVVDPKSIINLKKLIILDLGQSGVQYLPRGLGKLSNLQELSGFRISANPNKACCGFSELKELKQLRVLRINLCDESTISEDELTALSQLDKLKVLGINADECSSSSKKNMAKFGEDHILNMLDRLSPPSSLQELYLKNCRRDTLWQWINPDVLSKLRYLCIEDGNLEQLQSSEGRSSTWKIEGLYLKFLQKLDVEWEMLNKDMPLLRYVEASHCSSLKGFPFDPKRLGVWNKINQ